MNQFIKYLAIVASAFALGFMTHTHQTKSLVKVEDTQSGLYVISDGRIYQLFELANDVPPFQETYKKEKGIK